MKPRSIPLLACLALGPAASLAQDGPAFDCAKAESSAEKLVCDDADLAALDRRLADRFAAAVEVAEGLDVGAEEATDTLRAMQRGWISGRDECWKEPDLRVCVETAYLRREGELVAEFMLEPPSETLELTCGPRELTAMTFATDLPGLRIEEGDSVYVGAQFGPDTPSTYYMRSAGGLVMDGDTISVSDAYGEEHACQVR
ncbi:MAG: lysozyme inhibitor LprI family protein [Pseudooceanicola atlanticus]